MMTKTQNMPMYNIYQVIHLTLVKNVLTFLYIFCTFLPIIYFRFFPLTARGNIFFNLTGCKFITLPYVITSFFSIIRMTKKKKNPRPRFFCYTFTLLHLHKSNTNQLYLENYFLRHCLEYRRVL